MCSFTGRVLLFPSPRFQSRGMLDDEEEEGWLAIGKPRSSQCHAAFIVLQQKGGHQSTGISSRLISRGRGGTDLTLFLFPFLFFRPRHPSGRDFALFHTGTLSSSPSLYLSLTLSLFSPPSGRRCCSSRRCSFGGGADSGNVAVVMKTYEIYSIWSDAITPARTTNRPPLFSLGSTLPDTRCSYQARCLRVYTWGDGRL